MPGVIICRKCGNVLRSCHCRGERPLAVRVYVGGRYKWHSGFRSVREAEVFQISLASHPAHAANLGLQGTTRERFGTYLRGWLKQRESRLRPKTIRTYRDLLELHIIEDLGGLVLAKVGPRILDEHYSRLLERGLSPTTVHHVAGILRRAFADALRQEIVARNPCDMTSPPKRQQSEVRTFDAEQLRLFLASAKRNSRHPMLYTTAVYTGMRQSELLGLRWQDVDPLMGTVTVRQQFYRIAGKQYVGPPKSKAAGRTIDLPADLIADLRRLRETNPHDLVFCQPNGKPLHANNIIRRDLPRILKRAKLPAVTFHSLRHANATFLLQQGVPIHVVQARLGHSDPATTLRAYSHLLRGAQAGAVRALSDSFATQTEGD